ncbi:MAG: DUF2007 domain-containing protein [Acidobacteria bacterium]|nr:DUF2007 domain-containing protein [Acidobacteriota bacterium]
MSDCRLALGLIEYVSCVTEQRRTTRVLITIASFDHPLEANLAKTRLEAEGIECVLTNEHIAGMNWVWAPTIGGVGLQVLEADARRAMEILEGEPDDEERADEH